MPPKKAPAPSKKAETKKKEKIIEVFSDFERYIAKYLKWREVIVSRSKFLIHLTGQDVWSEEQEGRQDSKVYRTGREAGENGRP
jgi:hypothetical protein